MTRETITWSTRRIGYRFLANVSPTSNVRKIKFELSRTGYFLENGGIFMSKVSGIMIIETKVNGVQKKFIPFDKRVSKPDWLVKYESRVRRSRFAI